MRTPQKNVSFEIADLTDSDFYKSLGDLRWDIILCSMVLHDCHDISKLAFHLPNLLADKGIFVFSIPHPCFNTPPNIMNIVDGGCLVDDNPVLTLQGYSQEQEFPFKGKPNQPIAHPNFHRPIHKILNLFFKHGMCLTGFEEPHLSEIKENFLPSDSLWSKLAQFPPVLICRMEKR
jgi:hypothetical protein